MNGFLLGLLQQAPWGLAVVAIVWIRMSSFERRLGKLEDRFDEYMNHGRK